MRYVVAEVGVTTRPSKRGGIDDVRVARDAFAESGFRAVGFQFQLVEADELESARIRNMIEGGAYTQTLSMFFATSSGAQPDSVRIVSATLEPASARVDKTAFVLGGKLAVELPLKP